MCCHHLLQMRTQREGTRGWAALPGLHRAQDLSPDLEERQEAVGVGYGERRRRNANGRERAQAHAREEQEHGSGWMGPKAHEHERTMTTSNPETNGDDGKHLSGGCHDPQPALKSPDMSTPRSAMSGRSADAARKKKPDLSPQRSSTMQAAQWWWTVSLHHACMVP